MRIFSTTIVALILFCPWSTSFAKEQGAWSFAVSGDSRNCGDIVMPAIAADLHKKNPSFYWHLGDFRKGEDIDDDIAHDNRQKKTLTIEQYRAMEWQDFIENQINPFSPVPVYLAIGNHELIGHSREEYLQYFHSWLNLGKASATYYHWIHQGVDFISLDNASHDQFDAKQMDWVKSVLAADEINPKIHTIVVGMHAALPDSISFSHSMSESKDPNAVTSGRELYQQLLHLRGTGKKNVYVLASHSHFFMEGIFNTAYWKAHGGVLPGWIIGTAGALRYALPKDASLAIKSQTHVYGYLLAKVKATGKIDFEFHLLEKDAVLQQTKAKYGDALVTYCFEQNAINKLPE